MSRRLAHAAFVALLALGCSSQDLLPAPEGPGRMARRFLPFEAEWRPESEIPRRPQASPAMVIWELTALPPDAEPTAEQLAAAEDLIERSYRAAVANGWFSFRKGLADGFELLHADRRHYYNEEYVLDEHVLDPDRPEFLMYYGTPEGKKLTGFMFYMSSPTGWGPQIGGPATLWHYHVWTRPKCMLEGMLLVADAEDGRCERGVVSHRSPEMLHVWLIDHPHGPFATSMYLESPVVRQLLEKRRRERPDIE